MIGRRLLLLLAVAATRDDPLAGRIAGPPVDCIDLDRVQGPDIVDGSTILYRQTLRRVWRTSPLGGCGPMRPGDGLNVAMSGHRLCRGDRFRVRSPGYVSAALCRFDAFVPFDKPPVGPR